MAQRYGYNVHVSPQAAAQAAVDLFEHAEIKAVTELAKKVHQDGMQFVGWPSITRIPLVFRPDGTMREARTELGEPPQMWNVEARVVCVPRPPVVEVRP